ncbi:MAG: hypothetical protein HDR43_01170 [Mycoplasma sp.]|nr:hypothetical protein [Mycoplasma sp.]
MNCKKNEAKPIVKISENLKMNIFDFVIGNDNNNQSILLYLVSENNRLTKTMFNSIKSNWGIKDKYNELLIKSLPVNLTINKIRGWEIINNIFIIQNKGLCLIWFQEKEKIFQNHFLITLVLINFLATFNKLIILFS